MEQELSLREISRRYDLSLATLNRWKAADTDFPKARRYSAQCTRYSEAEFAAYMGRRAERAASLPPVNRARLKELRALRETKKAAKSQDDSGAQASG